MGVLSRLLRVVAVAVLIVAGACTSSHQETSSENNSPQPDEPAHGFNLSTPPDGFVVRSAVNGTGEPQWSSDELGGVHPAVVLVPNDWDGIDDVRWVVVESFDGSNNQGGARQVLPTYLDPRPESQETINGFSAVTADIRQAKKSDADIEPAFVAVDTSGENGSAFGTGDHGYAVSGPGRTLEELILIAKAVTESPVHLPVLIEPPTGWSVLASLTGEQLVGGGWAGYTEQVQTGCRAVTIARTDSPARSWLTVTSLPGTKNTAAALAIAASWDVRSTDQGNAIVENNQGKHRWFSVAERPRLFVTIDGSPFSIATEDDIRNDDGQIVNVLGSLQRVDDDAWNTLVESLELSVTRARPGSEMIASGSDNDMEWSIQATRYEIGPTTTAVTDPPTWWDVGAYEWETVLVVAPKGRPAYTVWLREPSGTNNTSPPGIALRAAYDLGDIDGWFLGVQAPQQAASATYTQDGVTMTLEFADRPDTSIGGIRVEGDVPFVFGEVKIFDEAGNEI